MDNSAELLESTNLKIKNVAETVGIANPLYFSQVFKKYKGVTPKEYREKNRIAFDHI